MKVDDLMKYVEDQLNIDASTIDKKIYDVPKIHNNIMRHYFTQKQKLIEMEVDLNKAYKQKYHYYAYDYEFKLSSEKQIVFHVEGDEEFSEKRKRFNYQKLLVEFLSESLKKANALSFDVKNIIEYTKFISGNG